MVSDAMFDAFGLNVRISICCCNMEYRIPPLKTHSVHCPTTVARERGNRERTDRERIAIIYVHSY
jgi:hypothetical protein